MAGAFRSMSKSDNRMEPSWDRRLSPTSPKFSEANLCYGLCKGILPLKFLTLKSTFHKYNKWINQYYIYIYYIILYIYYIYILQYIYIYITVYIYYSVYIYILQYIYSSGHSLRTCCYPNCFKHSLQSFTDRVNSMVNSM